MNLSMLRTYRAQLEETLRAELAALQKAVERELEARRLLEEEREGDVRRYLAEASRGMTGDEAVTHQIRLDALTEAIRQAAQAVEAVQRRWEQKRAEVLDASRESKKLEILEERQVRAERLRERRREQGLLDEAAGRRRLANGGRDHA